MDALDYALRNKVSGWLQIQAVSVIDAVAATMDVRGRPICEIGVHHGKFFIFLALLAGGRAVGYDLFSRQEENVDRSGRGDMDIFRSNVETFIGADAPVSAITANSLELTPERIIQDCNGRPVLFSIDGGHTVDITLNDLRVAAKAIADDGLVILDDAFNEYFPEVAEGFFEFLREDNSLTPFCTVGNKVLLAPTPELARERYSLLIKRPPHDFINLRWSRSRTLAGSPVCAFSKGPPGNVIQWLRTKNWFNRFKRSPIGDRLRRFANPAANA